MLNTIGRRARSRDSKELERWTVEEAMTKYYELTNNFYNDSVLSVLFSCKRVKP